MDAKKWEYIAAPAMFMTYIPVISVKQWQLSSQRWVRRPSCKSHGEDVGMRKGKERVTMPPISPIVSPQHAPQHRQHLTQQIWRRRRGQQSSKQARKVMPGSRNVLACKTHRLKNVTSFVRFSAGSGESCRITGVSLGNNGANELSALTQTLGPLIDGSLL